MKQLLILIVGTVGGGLVSWLIADAYYRRSSIQPPDWARPLIEHLPKFPPTPERLLQLYRQVLAPEDQWRRVLEASVAQREIENKSHEMARLLGAEAPPIVMPTRKTLFYFKPSDTNRVAAIAVAPPQGPLPESPKAWGKRVHRAPLWYLERRTRELAEETGFASAAVVDYVLTGARPLLPPARVSEVRIYGKSADRYRVSSDGTPLPLRREAHITLHARDITHSQVRELYQALRGRLAVVQKKRSGIVKDTELFQLVGELGGLPERPTSREFWGRALKEWNRRTPKKWHVRNWRALMMRWMRFKERWPAASRGSEALFALAQRPPALARATGPRRAGRLGPSVVG